MNKAFKVLWNQVRGTYVVASEAQVTHGKPSKATKTIVAAAVAGLLALGGAASAEEVTVDFDYVQTEGTTKFISGDGNTLNIQTNASAKKLIEDLKAALDSDDKLNNLLDAIAQVNSSEETAILTGTVGGQNIYDTSLENSLDFAANLKPELDPYVEKVKKQFEAIDVSATNGEIFTAEFNSGTTINIGGSNAEPVLIATVGGDRIINAALTTGNTFLDSVLGIEGMDNSQIDVVRHNNVVINADSGNLLGLTGGSSAINLNGIHANYSAIDIGVTAKSTSTAIDGNVSVNLGGHTNAAGILLSGSAIALGGAANTTVSGNSTLNISSAHDEENQLSGLTVGAFGGGLAASTLDGSASATTSGTTTVNITDGVSVGVFGSGAALSAELEGSVWDTLTGLVDSVNSSIEIGLAGSDEEQKALLANGGKATVTSTGDITVNATGDSVTVGLAGGGFAAASSGGTGGTSEAHVETGDITLTLGTNAPTLENQDKIALQTTASNLIGAFKTTLGNLSIDSLLDLVDPVTDAVNKSQTNYQGAHVGNVGGSVVIARMPSSAEGTTAIATANSGNITVNLEGGYTVATLGGGMTIASGYGIAEGTKATSDVASTTMNITGGDNVLVMAGGAAYATGSNGQESKVVSQSNVEASTVNMTGGSVDGLFGGGLAIDDTNASGTNASAKTNSVAINIDGGTVNRVDSNGLTSLATGESSGAPSNGTYVNDTADLIGNKDKGNAAIVGAGIATGAQALVSSETVAINLNDGTVNGNVFAGGAATLGGKAEVTEKATIVLNGSTVEGDIYGGGLVGSERNNNFKNATQYAQASSSVNDVEIVLADGSVQNVYAGGYTHEESEGVTTNTVEKALIRLMATDVFKGKVIDGSGATTATLEITPVQYAFEDGQQISAFDTITAAGAVSNFSYDFGNKVATTLTGGPVDFVALTGTEGKTLALGTDEASGIASIAEGINLTGLTLDVNNGLLSFNADGATAMEIATTAPTQTKAMAYVSGNLDLTNAKVLVGDVESDVNGLYLGKDGTLIADAAAKSSVTGTADTANGTIHFVGVAQDDAQVTIAAAKETNTTVDNVLYKAVQTDNVYTFEARSGEELNEVGLGDFDDSAFLADLVHHDNKGARFIEGFLDQSNGSVTNANRSQQLNAAMNLATAAGVQTAAIDSATVGLDAANKRASIIHDPIEGGVLFAEASGRRTEMGGSADFGEIKSELGGVVVGGEYTTGDWTFGALANVGTGSVKGQGNNAGVDNDVDYYGAQIYTGKRFGQFNVVGQVGYLSTSNDITHSTLGINKADVDADVITVGVRGEMRFDLTANTRIVPYIGLNYLRVATDGYTTSQGVQVSDVDQNLFTLPVGVKYAGDMKTQSGWAWTPSVDLAYVAAFGDRDVDATTHVGAVGQTTMDVWAESTVRTTIGVKAQKDNFGFGVEAGGAFGSDDTKGLFGQVRVDYRF